MMILHQIYTCRGNFVNMNRYGALSVQVKVWSFADDYMTMIIRTVIKETIIIIIIMMCRVI